MVDLLTIALVLFALLLVYLFAVCDRVPVFDVDGAHIVVTGGSSGIGLATCVELARRGARVTIMARRQQQLDAAAVEVRKAARRGAQSVLTLSVDVTDEAATRAAFDEAARRNGDGRVDCCVLSAGVTRPQLFEDVEAAEFDRIMRVNFLGVVHSIKAVLPAMKRQGGGRIVMVSSVAGLASCVGYSAYAPSKYALRGLADSLHNEFQAYNVRVSLACPGDVETPMYEWEQTVKPAVTKAISDPPVPPATVARCIADGIRCWSYLLVYDFNGVTLDILGGLKPATMTQVLAELVAWPIIRLVSLGVLAYNNYVVRKFHREGKMKVKGN